MPDEDGQRAQEEPFLEISTPKSGKQTAGVIFVLTIILVVLITGFLIFYKYRSSSQASDKQQALQTLQDELNLKKNKDIENKAIQVNAAARILTAASKSKYLFRAFIDELVTKITNDTKLNNLSIDNTGKVTMDGQSASYRSVADLAVALQSSKKIKNVQISGLTQSTEAKTTIVTFSMVAEISDWKTASISEEQTTEPSAVTPGEALDITGGASE